MKRLIALLLILALLTGCTPKSNNATTTTTVATTVTSATEPIVKANVVPNFTGLSDTSLHTYLEDMVYTELVSGLNNENYFVENVAVTYVSKEYLEEIAYNSKENIYFGYSLSSLNEQFQGTRYIFSLGDNGETIVKEFEEYDDTFDQVLRNVAIGTGVILLCVTVSVVSGGAGAPAVAMIFAASAKTGAIAALSTGVVSGLAEGIVTGIETGDFDESLKAAALAGSEGFKWGAIGGSVSGGASKAFALKGATLNGLTMNEAALIQKQSGYPLDVIKQFSNMKQYEVCQAAGLTPNMVNGNVALIRNIDLNYIDEFGHTNLERMMAGSAALDPTGQAYELHHIGQKVDSTLAILTKAEHMQGGNNKIWHVFGEASNVHSVGNNWDRQRIDFWKSLAKLLSEGGA